MSNREKNQALGLPCDSDGKEPACNVGDWGSIPGTGSPGQGNRQPLQYSGLENSKGRGAWRVTFHGVAESDPAGQLTLSLSPLILQVHHGSKTLGGCQLRDFQKRLPLKHCQTRQQCPALCSHASMNHNIAKVSQNPSNAISNTLTQL